MKRKKINSYNMLFPHEPSPLLSVFRKNFELYPSIIKTFTKHFCCNPIHLCIFSIISNVPKNL